MEGAAAREEMGGCSPNTLRKQYGCHIKTLDHLEAENETCLNLTMQTLRNFLTISPKRT
jgi:hypothetical protein